MTPQPPRRFGLIPSLFRQKGSAKKSENDLLLQTAVKDAVAQLAVHSNPKGVPVQDVAGVRPLSSAYAAFGFHLLQLLSANAKHNIFISPISIALALSMVYNGASGETQREIAQVLQLRGMNIEELNKGCATLMALLNSVDAEVELCVANSLWMRHMEQILPEFRRHAKEYFQAELHDLAGAPDTINAWVNQHTQGKIADIVGEEVTREGVDAILVNAVYFRGRWTDPFETRNTRDARFTLLDGQKTLCKMMAQEGSYRYLQARNFQAVRLPYGEQNVSMYVFLPHPKMAYSEFLTILTMKNWTGWREEFRDCEGSLRLPRFRCEYTQSLNEALSRLRMSGAFSFGCADFSRLSPLFYLGLVQHKTFVDVQEEGTEAAAITDMAMCAGCADPPEPKRRFEMIVDRPFFCIIVDERTEATLFMGAIVEPQ